MVKHSALLPSGTDFFTRSIFFLRERKTSCNFVSAASSSGSSSLSTSMAFSIGLLMGWFSNWERCALYSTTSSRSWEISTLRAAADILIL